MIMTNKTQEWLDKQIVAEQYRNEPFKKDDSFYIRIAGAYNENSIHIYGIDNLCKELHIQPKVEYHDNEFDKHYFMYKGYKFFGLSVREDYKDERE